MNERDQLEKAIDHLESQRTTLGDAAVDAALAGLKAELDALDRSSEAQTAGHRKFVTIVFADLTGFTALTEQMDPEAARELTSACFEKLVPVIEKYGGTVDKYIGDEIMALFGAPAAHENDPERALRAALEMKVALGRLNDERGTTLTLHFGINTGLVFAGEVGTVERQDYSVVGDAVNLASRLEEASQRDEILVGPDTYRATAALFDFEELPPLSLKGKGAPVQAFRLLGIRRSPQTVRGLEARGISSPLVGRRQEMVLFEQKLHRLLAGQGGIIAIVGEAGVGKSRLVAEVKSRFVTRDQGQEIVWLEGKNYSYGETISFLPFQQIISAYAGIGEEDDDAGAREKLRRAVAHLFADGDEEIFTYLSLMLALGEDRDAALDSENLDSEAVGRRIFLAVRRFVRRLAAVKGLVLVIEDLHWIDESSARLLEHIMPLAAGVPLLICGLSRAPEFGDTLPWQRAALEQFPERTAVITLSPLAAELSRELVSNLLALTYLPDDISQAIIERSEGNPLYIEEIIRELIDRGAIVFDPKTASWRAAEPLHSTVLPETVQGIIMARVDRLDSNLRDVIGTAAVIGRTFLLRVLAAAVEKEPLLLQPQLQRLVEAEFIRKRPDAPEPEYVFNHVLVQESAYENMLLQRRRDLHARVGKAIENLFDDRLDEFYGLLAYHYALAEAWPKAQTYLLLAADQEGQMAADAEALAHYEQALEANKQIAGEVWSPLQRAMLARKIGEAYYRRGDYDSAIRYLHQALAHLQIPLPRSRWAKRSATLVELIRQAGHRLAPALFLKDDGALPQEEIEEIDRIYESFTGAALGRSQDDVILVSLKKLNFAERHHYVHGEIQSYGMFTVIGDIGGLMGVAERYGRLALDLIEEHEQPSSASFALSAWAVHQNMQGRWTEVLNYAEQARKIQQDRPYWNVLGAEFTTLCFADGYIHLGQFSTALKYAEELRILGEDGGDLLAWSWGLSRQGFALKGLGQIEEAIENLAQAMEVAQSMPNLLTYIDSGGDLAACFLRAQQFEKAVDVCKDCDRVARENGLYKSPTSTRYKNAYLETCLILAEENTGEEQSAWLSEAKTAGAAALKQGKWYVPGMAEALMLNGRLQWLLGDKQKAGQLWQQSQTMAEEMDIQFDLGRTLLEIGERLQDEVRLARAIAIFSETNSAWELARARRIARDLQA